MKGLPQYAWVHTLAPLSTWEVECPRKAYRQPSVSCSTPIYPNQHHTVTIVPMQTSSLKDTNKFKIIPITCRDPRPITINNTDMPYIYRGNIGLRFASTELRTHQSVTQAQTTLTKSRRFIYCTPQTKLRLYKTTIRPIPECTPIPLVAISYLQNLIMQSVQIVALFWIHTATFIDRITTETKHYTEHTA